MTDRGPVVHRHAVASRAKIGEVACGDRVVALAGAGSVLLCVADGTGHGAPAAAAAEAAIAYIARARDAPLAEIVGGCHHALRRTRGVALGLARVWCADLRLEYVGVGNTRALVAGARLHLLPATPGMVGARCPPVIPVGLNLMAGDFVLLASDAFPNAIDLVPYGPFRVDLSALVQCLVDDLAATRDDAAILVYEAAPP